jgi:hypothetical protein
MIDLSVMLPIAAVIGFVFGLVYFIWLWRSVSSLASAPRTAAHFVFGIVSRLAALGATVGMLLWLETAPLLLLLGGLGFFIARLVTTTVFARPASRL